MGCEDDLGRTSETFFLGRGGKDQPGRGRQAIQPPSATRGPVDLGSMRVEVVLKAWAISMGPRSPSPCSAAMKTFKAALSSYGCLGRDRQRNRGVFGGIFRGVSDPWRARRS
jgi:hypothetical protein